MKRCRCNEVRDELWASLVDSVTMRYEDKDVEFSTVVAELTPSDHAAAHVISRLECRPVRDILTDAISYCYLPTTADLKAEYEHELVDLASALGWTREEELV